VTRQETPRRTLLGLRLTDVGVEHCRSHVPQDELLVAAKRLGVTVEVVTRSGLWRVTVAGQVLVARTPGHLLEQIERLILATSGRPVAL
jgi:hypothetical protein